MNLFTKRVLYEEPSETSLCIGVAASIITLGQKIRLLMQQTDVSEWSRIDLAYIQACANAMELYVEETDQSSTGRTTVQHTGAP